MKKYNIFGIGAALVDTEIVVTDNFLAEHGVGKGLMTLVDEERQDYLIKALREQTTHVKKACGGSACNSIVAASSFGADTFYAMVALFEIGGSRVLARWLLHRIEDLNRSLFKNLNMNTYLITKLQVGCIKNSL